MFERCEEFARHFVGFLMESGTLAGMFIVILLFACFLGEYTSNRSLRKRSRQSKECECRNKDKGIPTEEHMDLLRRLYKIKV